MVVLKLYLSLNLLLPDRAQARWQWQSSRQVHVRPTRRRTSSLAVKTRPFGVETVSVAKSQGSYRRFAGVGRQFLNNSYTDCKQQKSFWSVLAKKAKHVLLEDDISQRKDQLSQDKQAMPSPESKQQHGDTSLLQRRLLAITSSFSNLGDSLGNAIEESLNKMEVKARDFMLSKRGTDSAEANYVEEKAASSSHGNRSILRSSCLDEDSANSLQQQPPFVKTSKQFYNSQKLLNTVSHEQADSVSRPSQHHYSTTRPQFKEDSLLRSPSHSAADKETQLKASRDNLARIADAILGLTFQTPTSGLRLVNAGCPIKVAMTMAVKAKLLLQELKDAKADLAVAKERCTKLEEENQMIRASISSGVKIDEEDLVRVQLETLLADKARLTQENTYFARENQFLREMIEFHRLTMQCGGNILEERMLELMEKSLDHRFEEDNELPEETIISTVTN